MRKKVSKFVSYLLVAALVMQDGITTVAVNNSNTGTEMTVFEQDVAEMTDIFSEKPISEEKSSKQDTTEVEKDAEETVSSEAAAEERTKEEETVTDTETKETATESETKKETETFEEDKETETETKTSKEDIETESETETETSEENKETETETSEENKETETEISEEDKETETEIETETEEKTVNAPEDKEEITEEYSVYPGDEVIVDDENLMPEDLFAKDDANESDLKHWEKWNGFVSSIEPGADNKSITLKISDTPTGADWGTGLKYSKTQLGLETGSVYQISFKITSTKARKIVVGFDNAGKRTFSLEQNKETTVTYYEKELGGKIFAFFLGETDNEANYGAHDITISDVSIKKVTIRLGDGNPVEETEDNLLTNGTFKDGNTDGWSVNKETADVKCARYRVAFDITGNPADWQIWLKQDIVLDAGTKYKISFDATSTVNRYIMAGCDNGTWLQHKELKANEPTKVEYQVTGVSGNNFVIALGSGLRGSSAYKDWDGNEVPAADGISQTLDPHRVTISNVCITELPVEGLPDTPNDIPYAKITNLKGHDGKTPAQLAPLKDGKFTQSVEVTMGDGKVITSPENASWALWHEEWMNADGVQCIPDEDGMTFWVKANTGADDNGNHPWDVQFNQKISLAKNTQYVLSFTLHSDKARSFNISIGDIGGVDENGYGIPWVKPIAIQKNETREVVLNLPVLAEDASDKTFMIQLGHIPGTPNVSDNKLTFTDMKLEVNGYAELAERISDGYFNDGAQGNFTVVDNSKADVSFDDSYIYADILSDCVDSDVTVSSGKFDLLGDDNQYDYQYEVSFIAGATEDRTIKAAIVGSTGNTLQEQSFDLTTEAKKYSFIYKPNKDQKNAALKLMLGGSKGTVCVDTVRCDLKGYPVAAGLDTQGHDITILEQEAVPVISEMPADQAVAGNDIVISFNKEGNEVYKDKIDKILIDGVEVADGKYTIGERTGVNGRNDEYIIILDKSLFHVKADAEEGRQVFSIEVRAPWYQNNKLHQTVYTKSLWKNTWLEEFDGTQLDMSKWSYQTGRGDNNDGWGNREQQCYTNSERNLKVSDGELLIKARKEENASGAPYTSARIWTMNDDGKTAKFSQKYGRMEAKMRVDAGRGYNGIWPAFWMLPVDLQYGTWPLSGEIDILEARGREPHLADGTVHFGKPAPNNESSGGVFDFTKSKYNQDSDINDYHIYAVEWEPGEIRWYVDDELYFKESNWYSQSFDNPDKFRYPAPFDQEFYIILNLAIGGMFDDDRLPLDDKMPADMKVDYVRVYESVDGYNEVKKEPSIDEDENVTPYDPDVKSELLDTDFTGINLTDDGDTIKRNVWNLVTLPSFGGKADFATIRKDNKTYARITPKQLGSAAHSIQLIQHLDLVKGSCYRISFDAWTEGSRNLNMKIGQDGSEGWNAYQTFETSLTESPKHYQYEFQSKVTDLHSRVEFNLATSNCPVYIGNIKYEPIDEIVTDPDAEKTPSENGNCVYNGSFDVGAINGLSYWHMDAGSDGKTVHDEEERGYQFTAAKGNLYQNGLQLLKGDSYKMTFWARAESERQIEVTLSDKDGTSVYHKETVTLTPEGKIHEFSFDMKSDTDTNTRLCFTFGDSGAKIDMTSIRLERTTYNNIDWDEVSANPLLNGDFELGSLYWSEYNAPFTIKEENGNHYAEVPAKQGGNKWDAVFSYDGVAFTANTEYEFSFRIKASEAGEYVRVTLEDPPPSYYAHYRLDKVEIGTEWATYTYDIKFREPHNLSLKFCVGGANKEHKVCIDDVVIRAKGAPKAPGIVKELEKYNRLGTDIVLAYEGEEDWAKNAVVYIDDKPVVKDKAVFKDGKLTLDHSVFSESKKYTLVVRSEGYTMSRSIEFMMYPANGNRIINGDFALGWESWGQYIRDNQKDYIAQTEDGAMKIHYGGPGDPQTWAIQLIQEGIPVEKGKEYQLSFYARATKARQIGIIHNQGSEEIFEYVEIPSVTSGLELYKVNFTTTEESDTLKLQFLLSTVGHEYEAVTATHDIYLDDICLLEVPEGGSVEVDKSILQGLINDYAALKDDMDKYTNQTYAVFEKAYAEAEIILQKENVDQAELIRAENNLRSAVNGLQMRGDKSALRELIQNAQSYKEADYTPASWKIFADALSSAENVVSDEEAVQEMVDKACDILTRAVNGLVSNEMVNELKELIKECATYKNEGYTAKSWKRFETALSKAEEAVKNENATKDDITSAQNRLESARASLEWDKTDLKKLIEKYESLDEQEYTPESWKVFNDALETAKKVAQDKGASKEEISDAQEKLETAKAALELDKTELENLIKESESLKEQDYTPESWKVFDDALKAAKEVAKNSGATKAEIEEACNNLKKAKQKLIPFRITTDDLVVLIKDCESLKADDYTSDTWKIFESALNKAKEVAGNPDAAQEEIDKAYNDLVEARDLLVDKPDPQRTELGSLIAECKALNREDYTDESWIPFDKALTEAEAVLADNDATQEAMQRAIDKLKAAKDGLQKHGEPDPVNKDQLRNLIQKCEALNKNDYMPDSWKIFEKALEDARAVEENETATQEDVQNVVQSLSDALDQLKEREGLWAFDIADITYTGKAVKPDVTVYNGKTLLVQGRDYTVSYKNNKKVTESGAQAVIKGKGNYSGSITKVFQIVHKDLKSEDILISDLYVKAPKKGKSVTPSPIVIRNGKKLSKKEYMIGSIKDNSGNLVDKVTNPGTYTVAVKGVEANGYTGTKEIQMTVLDSNQILMSAVKVTGIKNKEYTGEKIEPEFTVKYGKDTLIPNQDYVVLCDSSEIGVANAVIKGIGEKYVGEKTVTFKITGTVLKAKDVTVDAANAVYTGSAVEPVVNVAGAERNRDYIVSYDDNIEAGIAVVTVKGIGQYTGTVRKKFKIAAFDMKESGKELKYNTESLTVPYAKGGSKLTAAELDITFNEKELTEGVDYTLVYTANKKAETTASVRIKGKGNFKGMTDAISFKVMKQDLAKLTDISANDVIEKNAKNYNHVIPVIKDLDGKTLKKGTDFKITSYTTLDGTEFTEIPNVGDTVRVTVEGINNYKEQTYAYADFRIIENNMDISKAKVKVKPQSYTGKDILLSGQQILITMKGNDGKPQELEEGRDYEIVKDSYSNNINKGTGKVTIHGIGAYGGTKTVSFKITAHDLNDGIDWYENLYNRTISWFNELVNE